MGNFLKSAALPQPCRCVTIMLLTFAIGLYQPTPFVSADFHQCLLKQILRIHDDPNWNSILESE